MSRINKSQFAILGLINKKPRSGYALKKIFARFGPFYWSESNAQIYPMLKRLEQDQMVTSTIDEASGARQKRIYTITEKGISHLNAWLELPPEPSQYREELLIKLSVIQHLPKKIMLSHVKIYEEDLKTQEKILQDNIEHIKTDHKGRSDQQNLLLSYDYADMVLAAKLAWCQKTLKSLKA